MVLQVAQDELDRLWDIDEDAAAEIYEWLDRFDQDQKLLDTLTVHDYGAFGTAKPYHVSKWQELWIAGKDIWRLKFWGLSRQYRTVYAFQPRTLRYTVLGVPPRDFGYNVDHPISRRMIGDYDNL